MGAITKNKKRKKRNVPEEQRTGNEIANLLPKQDKNDRGLMSVSLCTHIPPKINSC